MPTHPRLTLSQDLPILKDDEEKYQLIKEEK